MHPFNHIQSSEISMREKAGNAKFIHHETTQTLIAILFLFNMIHIFVKPFHIFRDDSHLTMMG